MRFQQLAGIVGGTVVGAGPEALFQGVSTDSRRIKGGELFVALEGENFDGHDFMAQALAAGAAGVLARVEKHGKVPSGMGAVLVPDTLKALGDLAADHRRRCAGTWIAVTGSNGKTTTKEMIAHVLSGHGNVVAAPMSFNNAIGLPLTVLSAEGDGWVVAEVGTSAPGEIKALARIVSPTIAVVTNVSETHLEKLGSVEGVAAEKSDLVAALDPRLGTAVLNADDKFVNFFKACTRARVVTFGMAAGADIRATDVRAEEGGGVTFRMNERVDFKVPLLGEHNVYNALAAAAVCRRAGLEMEAVAERLSSFQPAPMRMNVERVGGVTVIDDSYNANPRSMLAAVKTLAGVKSSGKRILVAGDMLELGKDSSQFHRRIGEAAGEAKIDVLFAYGGSSKAVLDGAAGGVGVALGFTDFKKLAKELRNIAQKNDVVLIKGSRRMGLDKLAVLLKESLRKG